MVVICWLVIAAACGCRGEALLRSAPSAHLRRPTPDNQKAAKERLDGPTRLYCAPNLRALAWGDACENEQRRRSPLADPCFPIDVCRRIPTAASQSSLRPHPARESLYLVPTRIHLPRFVMQLLTAKGRGCVPAGSPDMAAGRTMDGIDTQQDTSCRVTVPLRPRIEAVPKQGQMRSRMKAVSLRARKNKGESDVEKSQAICETGCAALGRVDAVEHCLCIQRCAVRQEQRGSVGSCTGTTLAPAPSRMHPHPYHRCTTALVTRKGPSNVGYGVIKRSRSDPSAVPR